MNHPPDHLCTGIRSSLGARLGIILSLACFPGAALALGLPANTEVISRQELERGLYGYDLFDVLAALNRRAGITVKSSSDVGAEDWVLIRGLPRDSSRNVLVLIDGMPLNDAAIEANEFEHLPPIELIERIVVYKPPVPARFGGYHSVIEVRTRRSVKERSTEAGAAYGSRQTVMGSVASRGGSGKLAWLGSLDYLSTDNLSGVQRTPPRENQTYGDRSYRRIKPAAQLIYAGARGGLALYGQYIESRKFFSDTIFRGSKEGRDRTLAAFNLSGWMRPTHRSELAWNLFRSNERYQLNLRMHPSFRDQERYKQGGRFSWTWQASSRQRWSFGGEITERYATERLGSPLPLTRIRSQGLFAEYSAILGHGLTIDLGWRRDALSRAAPRWNYTAGVRWRPAEPIEVYALRGRATRWPALSLVGYWYPGEAVTGESLTATEVGGSWRMAQAARLRLSAFDLRLRNEARFVRDATGLSGFRPQPDGVLSRGIEATMELSLTPRWSAFANYTLNRVLRDGGQPVRFSGPRVLANVVLQHARARITLDAAARYGGKATGVQAMGGGPTVLDRWLVLDLAARFRLSQATVLFVRASNLLDERYETFDGRPMFGRVVIAGFSGSW